MKVSNNKSNNFLQPQRPPPILYGVFHSEDTKKEKVSFKLRSNPADAASIQYSISVPVFNTDTPSDLLFFEEQLKKVFIGQGITTGPAKFQMTRRLLRGEALQAYNAKATASALTETNENHLLWFQAVLEHVFPQKALKTQRRYMKRILRKTKEVSICTYLAWFTKTNEKLKRFPPFQENQALSTEEIIEYLKFAIPSTWRKQMVMHDFDPIDHSTSEFTEFCERLEFAEDLTTSAPKHHQKSQMEARNNGF